MRKLQILLPMLLLALFSFAQQKIITGRVISKTTGEPLQGVSVQAKNKTVTTDAEGKFSLPVTAGETISLSFVGMNLLKVKIANVMSSLSLTMEEGSNDLNLVVVTGYKTEKKVDLTGAVSIVNLANVKNNPVASPMLALQGQVPGLYIQTDGSPTGANGAAPTVDRMINVFPSDKQSHVRTMLSTSLRGVVSQQLLQKSDKSGRVAALEILVNTSAAQNLIRQGKLDQLENVMQAGGAFGMRTMDTAIQQLLDSRQVTGKEAYKKGINKVRFEAVKDQG